MYGATPTIPLGTIDESNYTLTSATITSGVTYAQDMEKFILSVLEKWAGKKIGMYISYKGVAHLSATNPYRLFIPQMEAVARKYSIPLLNLFDGSNIPQWNQTLVNTYFFKNGGATGDGTHLNSLGYNLIEPKIEAWVKSL